MQTRLRLNRRTAVLAVFVMLTTAISGAAWYRDQTGYNSRAAGGWQSGASGDGVSGGQFAAWRGAPVYIAGTWSVWGLPSGKEYGSWNGDLDVGVWGAGTDGNFIGWSSAANGGADSIWTEEFNVVKDWLSRHPGKIAYMRFAYEYNGGFMPYNTPPGDVQNFITAFRKWADRCHAISGCKTVWANNDGSGGQYDPRTAYPGSQYVDVVGVDTYNQWPWVNSDAEFASKIQNTTVGGGPLGIEKWRQYAESQGKPISIPEWANCSANGGGGGGDSANYIQNMYNWMSAHAGSGPGQVIYDVYFNVEHGYNCNFGVYPSDQGAPQTAAKYKTLNWGNGGLGSGGGGGGGGGTPVPTPVPPVANEVAAAGNLLAGKAFTSSVGNSTSEPGHPPSYLTDGNGATRWISLPTSPVNLTADMGASYTLSKVSVKWAGDTINHFQIQVSPDNATWTTVVTGNTNNSATQYADYTSFTATPTGRYLRIVGTDRWNAGYGNSIWEIGAYGGSAGGDKTVPYVTMTSPAAGASLKGTVPITGTASDNVAVTKVELLVDGGVKATNNSGSANFNWASTGVGDGRHTMSLRAFDAAGNPATSPPITVTVNNSTAAPAPSIQNFAANPATVTAGSRSTLTWVTTGVTACSVNPGGPQSTGSTYWQTPNLTATGTTTYTLTCQNSAGQSTSQTTTVTVGNPTSPPNKPILVATSTVIPSGNPVTLSWSSPGSTSCTLNPGGVSGAGSIGSFVTGRLTSTTAYSVTCQNAIGATTSDPLTITISGTTVGSSEPSIVSLFADPARIAAGQTSTIYWTTTGIAAGDCNLNPSPLNTTGPNGSWTTPYLLGSKSYTLTCVGDDAQVVSKSVEVVVNGISVGSQASSVAPVTNAANSTQTNLTASNGQKVTNGAVATTVSGYVTLDPSNITNSSKEKSITKVEYYEGQNLIQTDAIAPFVLDSTKLSNGSHTITERTYYADGSKSEVVRILSVQNTKAVAKTSSLGAVIAVVMVLLFLGGGGAAAVFFLKRRQVSVADLRSRYGNSIDTSLLDQPK